MVRELVAPVELIHVDGRAADFRGAIVSGERAARELGWRASTPFREGARRYVEWFLATQGPANGNGAPAALGDAEPGLATP